MGDNRELCNTGEFIAVNCLNFPSICIKPFLNNSIILIAKQSTDIYVQIWVIFAHFGKHISPRTRPCWQSGHTHVIFSNFDWLESGGPFLSNQEAAYSRTHLLVTRAAQNKPLCSFQQLVKMVKHGELSGIFPYAFHITVETHFCHWSLLIVCIFFFQSKGTTIKEALAKWVSQI